jgi:hypothetical protein
MKAINFILNLFIRRRQPVFGPRIFQQQTWLDKQVQESLRKRNLNLD